MSDLNRALSNIVGNLTELLSKINENNTQPSKVKKTPEMSYHEFLTNVLAGEDPVDVSNKNVPYRLQEDLQLLLDLSEVSAISTKTFEQISNSKRIQRSTESLARRYYETLSKIDEGDMKKIVNWVENEGTRGFLSFVGEELYIQTNEPYKAPKRRRAASLEREAKKQERFGKGVKLPSNNNCKELNETLRAYSKMVNIPMKTLVQKLHQVSGDLVELDKYVESKDARLLWTEAED